MQSLKKLNKEGNIMPEREIRFPDLNLAFEGAHTLGQVCKNYEKLLREEESLECMLYANKLEQFRKMTLVSKLRELEKEFQELKERVRELCRENDISVELSRRRKSFLGINEKIARSLRRGIPLEKVQDMLGFRLVLLTGMQDDEDSIKLCYQLLAKIIEYFVIERNCLLTLAEPVVDTGFKQLEHQEIIVPKESLLNPMFRENVKDYILNPKQNGYQSLHVVFTKPDGLLFEVQVRTIAMEYNAEFGTAAHGPYKADKYHGDDIYLDLNKVQIPGFRLLPNGLIDKIGLVRSIDPFNFLSK